MIVFIYIIIYDEIETVQIDVLSYKQQSAVTC